MTMALVNQIAADLAEKSPREGRTAETIVTNWAERIKWLGFKVGGKAWIREMTKCARNGWIATTQKTTVFLAPSEETLAWGGFLGGEFVSTEELRISAKQAFVDRFGADV